MSKKLDAAMAEQIEANVRKLSEQYIDGQGTGEPRGVLDDIKLQFEQNMTTNPIILEADADTILDEAKRIIHGQRRTDYGSPLESFERIASLWSVVLGIPITPEQACLCLVQLKVARCMQGFHRDSIVDIAGYAGCLELIQNEKANKDDS